MNLLQSTNIFCSDIKCLAFLITRVRTILTEDVTVNELNKALIGLESLGVLLLLMEKLRAVTQTET